MEEPWKEWEEAKTAFIPGRVWRAMNRKDILTSLEAMIPVLRDLAPEMDSTDRSRLALLISDLIGAWREAVVEHE
jgi:hypothetical protein